MDKWIRLSSRNTTTCPRTYLNEHISKVSLNSILSDKLVLTLPTQGATFL